MVCEMLPMFGFYVCARSCQQRQVLLLKSHRAPDFE